MKLETIEAIGVARLLGVDLMTRKDISDPNNEKGATITEKEYDIILSEIVDAFINSNNTKRKNILAIMKTATMRCKDVRTKHSK